MSEIKEKKILSVTLLTIMSLSFLLSSAVGSVIKVPVHIELSSVSTYPGPDSKLWIDGEGKIHFKEGIGTAVVSGGIVGTLTITDESGFELYPHYEARIEGFFTATNGTIYSLSMVAKAESTSQLSGTFQIDGTGIHIEGKISNPSPHMFIALDGIETIKH
jgi:hypothetical protein